MSRRNSNTELINEIENLIKKYNKKPEKKIKKKDIVKMLQNAEIIVPGKISSKGAGISDEVISGIKIKPDVVKDGGRIRLLPVFTSFSQIPNDYLDNFSFVKMNTALVYSMMEECEDISGMVVNPFTEYNLEIKKKLGEKKKTDTRHYKGEIDDNAIQACIIYDNKKYDISETPFTIGRENANIVIPQTYISKIHVVISYKDGKYRIADYASTNGTKVNGTTLKPKVYYELRDGYEIELSDKENMIVYFN